MNEDKIELKGFTYTEEKRVAHNEAFPDQLFKFYSLSSYNVDALVNGYFYASHPYELNDIMDSTYSLWIATGKIPIEAYYKLFGFGDLHTSEDIREIFDADRKNNHRQYITALWDAASNKFGIISLTEKENNLLMWPHYTGETGFQIKLTVDPLLESVRARINENELCELVPVNYVRRLIPVDLTRFKNCLAPFYYATNVKSKKWRYEKEWRLLVGGNDMGVPWSKVGFSRWDSHKRDVSSRYFYYDRVNQLALTFGRNFFNRDRFCFDEKEPHHLEITLKPNRKDKLGCLNTDFEILRKLLNYLTEGPLTNSLYLSGTKTSINEERQVPVIKRVKERIELKKIADNKFTLITVERL